jgi:alkylation response protein AidB-like acyl-CoA dehydrogenase
MEHRIAVRLAASNAIAQAVKAADAAYQLAGATVIFASGPFERRFRDLHTVAQQLQGRQSHFETVGRHLLGLEPDSGFI